MTEKISDIYRLQKDKALKKLAGLQQQNTFFMLLRIAAATALIGSLFSSYHLKRPELSFLAVLLLILFGLLVIKHNLIKEKIKYYQNLMRINEKCLLRLTGKWTGFTNTGKQFISPEHPYSVDLNIFGQGSLFQYIDATTTLLGREALFKYLTTKPDFTVIGMRQKAVRDLAGRLGWRQHYEASGLISDIADRRPEGLLAWAEARGFSVSDKYKFGLWFLPVLTFGLLGLAFFRAVPPYLWLITLFGQLAVVLYTASRVYQAFGQLGRAVAELSSFSLLLKCIEEEPFKAPRLREMQARLFVGRQEASQQVQALAKIADRMTFQHSPVVHFILNICVFWDLHTLQKVAAWKNKSGVLLKNWLAVIGEFDALSSIAGMAHDNPDWIYPIVAETSPVFTAKSLGHPLINKETRVSNDVSVTAPGTTLIITGSNMSGKSTFLRTMGLNLVLAYCGAPVCAAEMCCGYMNIYTSIQVFDNLEQNVSTFYAEIKRIKQIIDAAGSGENLIFMIDEIFNGTNSKDRIFGAKTVVRKLSKAGAIGLVTTHDLEISVLEQENPLIKNYHFTDTITDNQISFDYRLKPGVSQHTNALALMKIIGIEE
ncbi:MAG: MutS family DNA mismatch repair protein [Thermincola sp.]|jgi:ABC-type multidrug transport system fused ATPase/permease subunit|nr:MutS family DNA mismatch repair protein [Thermincola sp.]MDT3702330.1 MutS family DNA mismatch repair protein [Thermincola sp.]